MTEEREAQKVLVRTLGIILESGRPNDVASTLRMHQMTKNEKVSTKFAEDTHRALDFSSSNASATRLQRGLPQR